MLVHSRTVGFVGGGRITAIFLEALGGRGLALERVTVSDTSAEVLAGLRARFPAITTTADERRGGGLRAGLPRAAPAGPEGGPPRDRVPAAAGRGRRVARAGPDARAASRTLLGGFAAPRAGPAERALARPRGLQPRGLRRRPPGGRPGRDRDAARRSRAAPGSAGGDARGLRDPRGHGARPTSGSSGRRCASWPRRSASRPRTPIVRCAPCSTAPSAPSSTRA